MTHIVVKCSKCPAKLTIAMGRVSYEGNYCEHCAERMREAVKTAEKMENKSRRN